MKIMFAAVVATTLAASSALAAPIVQNGSFEDGALTLNGSGWGVFNSLDGGWSTVSGAGIEIQTNPTLTTIDAQNGTRYVELDSHNNSVMKQTVNLLKSGNYILSFFYAPRNNNAASDGISYAIGNLSSSITAPAQPGLDGWTKVSALFTASAGANDLTFGAIGENDSLGGLIDNVSINPSPVPIPAAGFLLMGAIGGLTALRRRKSTVAI